MFCNNWGFNNFYINRCMPMGFTPYWGGCGCNSFNSGFRFGMMNSLFNFMMPQQNMFMFQQSFAMPAYMPMFMPYNNIFAMANQLMAPAFNAPAYNFALTPQVQNRNLTEEFNTNYANHNTENNNFTSITKRKNTEVKEKDYKPAIDKNFQNSAKLDKNFLKRVKQVAKNLNCNYKDLLAVMNSESGISTTAWNGTTAVGLIQFTNASIDELNKKCGLNLTKEKIATMSPIEQLDLAEKYLKIAKSYRFSSDAKLSAEDLYAITFLPGRADREVLCTEGERGSNGRLLNYYEGNRGLDKNGDRKITKSELAQHLAGKHVDESVFA